MSTSASLETSLFDLIQNCTLRYRQNPSAAVIAELLYCYRKACLLPLPRLQGHSLAALAEYHSWIGAMSLAREHARAGLSWCDQQQEGTDTQRLRFRFETILAKPDPGVTFLEVEALPELERRLIRGLIDKSLTKFEMIECIYGADIPLDRAENRLKNLLNRLQRKFPGLIRRNRDRYEVDRSRLLGEERVKTK